MLLLLLLSLLLTGLEHLHGVPAGREVYRMPQSALKALSDRGTVVLEAAMAGALSTLERASSERSRAEAGCRGCVPCLFQNCGQLSGSCMSSSTALSEPICDVVSKAQKLVDEAERSWALSQACAYYQHRCPSEEVGKESCIRIMGESCSARVLQCSLLSTMQNLEPSIQTQAQAVCGRRLSSVQNVTQPRSRIVGGSPAPHGSWPWLVNLQLDGSLMCGGVLVDSSWVVTAAHCFAGTRSESYWTAVVGEFDITKTDPDEQVLRVNRVIPHPKFNPKTFNNDLALVELTSPVILSEHVTPVCLPSATDPPTGTPCLVAGWGSLYEDGPSADVVMEAKVPLLPQSTCKSALGKDLVTNTMFCAGYLSGGIDSCQGDSGGPLIYQDQASGRFQLFGITSWGDGCGEKGKPGVYTRVSAFADWIQAEIQKSVGSREPTCSDLLKTTDMTEEQQRSEFSSLCRFYTLTCPQTQPASSCSRMAEDKCFTRFKKCQLRSFLQTLLDLLQRAEDYIRDRVDLTFFTQTLPQLVDHIYSTAFTHGREKRDAGLSQSTTQTQENLFGNAVTEEQRLPAMFTDAGHSVEDWEEYLRGVAEEMEEQHSEVSPTKRQEEKFFTEMGDSLVHQLDKQYQTLISNLHSKLSLRATPPVVNLDLLHLYEESPFLNSPTTTPSLLDQPSVSLKSLEVWSPLAAWMNEIQKLRTPGWSVEAEGSKGQNLFSRDENPEINWGPTQEDFVLTDSESTEEIETSAWPETVTDLMHVLGSPYSRRAGKPVGLHRKHRSLLQKRQIAVTSEKICPGLRESSQQIIQIRDSYNWVLNIPSKNLHMKFQEVLVDLRSKNSQGLYQARIKAVVGGRFMTFYSLVGLENESFYRSLPRIIALALDALKS